MRYFSSYFSYFCVHIYLLVVHLFPLCHTWRIKITVSKSVRFSVQSATGKLSRNHLLTWIRLQFQKIRKGRGAISRSQWCGEIGAGPSTRLQCYATTGRVVVWLAGGTNCLPRTWFPFIRKQPRIRYLFASFFFFFCRWIFRKNLLSVHINAGFKKLKRVYSLHVLSVLNFD